MGIKNFNSGGKKRVEVERILEGHLFPLHPPTPKAKHMHSIVRKNINTLIRILCYTVWVSSLLMTVGPLLWAACEKITIRGVPNCKNDCVIFILYS